MHAIVGTRAPDAMIYRSKTRSCDRVTGENTVFVAPLQVLEALVVAYSTANTRSTKTEADNSNITVTKRLFIAKTSVKASL